MRQKKLRTFKSQLELFMVSPLRFVIYSPPVSLDYALVSVFEMSVLSWTIVISYQSRSAHNRNRQRKTKSWIRAIALKATNRSFSMDFRVILREFWARFCGGFLLFSYLCTDSLIFAHFRTYAAQPTQKHTNSARIAWNASFPAVGVPWLRKAGEFDCVLW